MTIQRRFGGFNPRFIGATIHIENKRTYDIYNQLQSDIVPDIDSLSQEYRYEFLSIMSTAAHETRHVHDFLLCPYYAYIYARRVNILVNTMQLWSAITGASDRGECNCVIAPLDRWCLLDKNEREKWIQRAEMMPPNRNKQALKPFDCPFINGNQTPEELFRMAQSSESVSDAQIMITLAKYQQLNDLSQGLSSSVMPYHVFELSALMAQFEKIKQVYGLKEMVFYLNAVLSEKDSPYAMILDDIRDIWCKTDESFDLKIPSALAFWSILGSYSDDKYEASPDKRYSMVKNIIAQSGISNISSNITSLFSDWSNKTGLSTVKHGVLESLRTFSKLEVNTKELLQANDLRISDDQKQILVKAISSIKKANEHMVDIFLSDPEMYICPKKYYGALFNYIKPPIRITFFENFHITEDTEEQFASSGLNLLWGSKIEKKRVEAYVVSKKTPSSVFCPLDIEAINEVSHYMCLSDRLFYKGSCLDPEARFAGEVFTKDAKFRILNL